ncbi:alpha/beta fold hydrolase [Paenochrobactrum pullorum]|uniref:alpha/beta fold hydrolase n=1 Tax=Paenochrobactrum pullorum TaxID=1324351 RepID=UPI0035BC0239
MNEKMRKYTHIFTENAALWTEVIGGGEPVIFLHANVCDSRMWHSQMEVLGRYCKSIAYDRRGFGKTRAKTTDFSSISDLMAVIEAYSEDRPTILIGCSQGAKIALDAALLHPSKIKAVALISPSVSGAPEPNYPIDIKELLLRQTQAITAQKNNEINAIKARLWLDGPLACEGCIKGQVRQLFFDMYDTALKSSPIGSDRDQVRAYQHLHEIEMPILVLWGSLDFPHIQERSQYISKIVFKGRGKELNNVAHLPNLEIPDEITEIIIEFVNSVQSIDD